MTPKHKTFSAVGQILRHTVTRRWSR